MDIVVDPLSPLPLYQQVRDQVVTAIAQGDLRRGDALVPVRRLGAAFGVNPATIAKGYEQLRTEGFVATNAKSGTFVARDPRTGPPPSGFHEDWRPRLALLIAEARAQGVEPADVRAAVDDVLSSLIPSESVVEAGEPW